MESENSNKDWLASAVGNKMLKALAIHYVIDDEEDSQSPQSVYLYMGSAGGAGFCCASDGESIEMTAGLPTETDLGEYGQERLRDVSSESHWKNLIGKRLIAAFLIVANGEVCMGMRLTFDSGLGVDLVNLGDELFIFERLSGEITAEENISFVEV